MKTCARLTATVLTVILLVSMCPGVAAAADPWPSGGVRVALDARRVAGPDRYATAVAIAREGFPGWTGVSHVVIASAESLLTDPSLLWTRQGVRCTSATRAGHRSSTVGASGAE